MKTTEAQDLALMKAKLQFMGHEGATFFTTILVSLKHEYSDQIPTAATDGLRIVFNPDFFMSLKPEERVGLLMHEVLHVAMSHMMRLGDRDHAKFNRAADYSINLIAIDAGFVIPEGGLVEEDYRNMTPELIYELLPAEPPGEDTPDDLIYGQDKEVQEAIDDILISAQHAAEGKGEAGNIPQEIRRYIEEMTNPTVAWDKILRGFFQRLAKNSYTWLKPNRRYMSQDIIMPTLAGKKLSNGAVAIDVSGSVSKDEFHGFVAEAHSILSKQSPDALDILQFDHKLKPVHTVKKLHDFKNVKFEGGGGTCIKPVLEWAAENKPNFLIVFTDGRFPMYDLKLKTPIIWLVWDNEEFKAPYGKTIHYQPRTKK